MGTKEPTEKKYFITRFQNLLFYLRKFLNFVSILKFYFKSGISFYTSFTA